jgi:hypothetical protein
MTIATQTTIKTGTNKLGDTTRLVYSTAGQEIAGAGTRVTAEKWGCISQERCGVTYGQWYKTQAQAQERFAQVTTGKAA